MTFLNVASSGLRNGCYDDARQLADLSVYLPPLQKVPRLPGHWLRAGGICALPAVRRQIRALAVRPGGRAARPLIRAAPPERGPARPESRDRPTTVSGS